MTTPEDAQHRPGPYDSHAEGAGEQAAAPPQHPETFGVGEPAASEQGAAADQAATERLEQAVRAVETALIEYEIAVESFRIEVENFARLHEERLGPLHQRLEELEALIAETIAARTGDPADRRRAEEARAQLLPMPQLPGLFEGWLEAEGIRSDAVAMLTGQSVQPPPRVRPGEQARKLFRELMRAAHPDLVTDETERGRRGAFVARVNQAYARGDVDALQQLFDEWNAGPAPEPTPFTRAEELAARLEWLAARKESLAAEAADLEAGAVGSMLQLAKDDPDALLEEIAADLHRKIGEREAELNRLHGGASQASPPHGDGGWGDAASGYGAADPAGSDGYGPSGGGEYGPAGDGRHGSEFSDGGGHGTSYDARGN
ncbi:hypothetical protein [Streptomyces lonarensis]|uniref:hypothetical protein n=1 Tax=Streptomyces lonarensis TaxID=700599 RepID=UPI0028AD2569|nr:hypothetical protein [Streptomyces lonarensis]